MSDWKFTEEILKASVRIVKKVLRYFIEGMSIAEITRKMGYKSEQHTKNRRYRCKLSLIKQIKSTYGLEEEYEYNEINRSLS